MLECVILSVKWVAKILYKPSIYGVEYRQMMKKFFILLFIFLFLSLSLFSEDIVSGKRYSEKEVESFNELILVVNVPIKKSNLEIYKLQKTKESIFDNKLIVWKTEHKNY